MTDEKKKAWWKSRTLWGVAIALGSVLAIVLADAGAFELSEDIRTQLLAVNFLGLGLAGYGRLAATSRLR